LARLPEVRNLRRLVEIPADAVSRELSYDRVPRVLDDALDRVGDVGRDLHEPPEVPNFGEPGQGPVLEPGMVLAIEPMVNVGKAAIETLADGWTVVTSDRLPSAHFEHTIVVTATGVDILTRL
jgi:hypothetical protein